MLCLSRYRTVSSLRNNLGLDTGSIVAVDLIFQGRRYQYITFEFHHLATTLLRERFCARVIQNRASILTELQQIVNVNTILLVDRTFNLRNTNDNHTAFVLRNHRGVRTYVTKSLHYHSLTIGAWSQTELLHVFANAQGFANTVKNTTASSLRTPTDTILCNGLTSYTAGSIDVIAVERTVSIINP